MELTDEHGKHNGEDGIADPDHDPEAEGEEFDLDDDSDRPMDRKTAKLLSEHAVEKHLRKLKKKSKTHLSKSLERVPQNQARRWKVYSIVL